VRLEFLAGSLASLPNWPMACLPMPVKLAGYNGVVGRDILQHWEVFYSGLRKRLSIRDYASIWGWLAS
jgi:hypothetical protein